MNHKLSKVKEAFVHKISTHLILGWVLTLLLLFIFFSLSEGVINNELNQFDQTIGTFIRELTNSQLTHLSKWVTRLGAGKTETLLALCSSAIFLFVLKEKWKALFLWIALGGGWLLNLGLKLFFQRERPSIQHLVEVGGYSFPSGHAMVSTIFYGMLGYLIWTEVQRRKASWSVPIISLLLILSIGLSRVYLGVHYPSDVIAGFCAGGVWLIVCIWGLRKRLS
ncbi:MAG: phosphatase PAP2 family protein [Anaerobacillus sp.]